VGFEPLILISSAPTSTRWTSVWTWCRRKLPSFVLIW